jgi:hypothetical protein
MSPAAGYRGRVTNPSTRRWCHKPRIDLERRDHCRNAAGQNDLWSEPRLAGAKCPRGLELVDFNILKATVDHRDRDEQRNRK